MSYMSNRTVLQKAEFALAQLIAGGGHLLPKQAERFMQLSTTRAVLIAMCTYRPMTRSREQIQQIGFSERILQPAEELTVVPPADHSEPDLYKVELDAKRFRGFVTVSDEVMEENIEEGDFRQTIMELIAPAAGRDLEEVVINGDVTSGDPFLAQFDGILVQAQSHIVDAAGAPISDDLLHDMMAVLPDRYKKNKRELAYFMAVNAEDQLRKRRSNRETAMGDEFTQTDKPIYSAGSPVVGVPLFPDNLGPTGDQTSIVLTPPKNIILGVRKQIQIRWKEQFEKQATLFRVNLQADTKYVEEPGCVKAINVQL